MKTPKTVSEIMGRGGCLDNPATSLCIDPRSTSQTGPIPFSTLPIRFCGRSQVACGVVGWVQGGGGGRTNLESKKKRIRSKKRGMGVPSTQFNNYRHIRRRVWGPIIFDSIRGRLARSRTDCSGDGGVYGHLPPGELFSMGRFWWLKR